MFENFEYQGGNSCCGVTSAAMLNHCRMQGYCPDRRAFNKPDINIKFSNLVEQENEA